VTEPRPPRHVPWPEDHRPTPFQAAVVAAVAELEPGDLATYAEIAEAAGHPGAGQAVANVLRSATGVPWWRVVPADGRVYRTHRAVQRPLLEAEGHAVDDDGRVRPADQDAVPTRRRRGRS
jgi:methylated-DNA-protein-cysteine methyltransferase-like protein